MSNTLFAALGSLPPLHSWLRRLNAPAVPAAHMQPFEASSPNSVARASGADLNDVQKAYPAATRGRRHATMPLRVVQVMEAGHVTHSGRMFISGRMADVCAELDRMVACESLPRLRVQAPEPAR